MKEFKRDTIELTDELKAYAMNEVELVKLEAIEKTSDTLAYFFTRGILGFILILSYFMMMLALGFYLNDFLSNDWMGFAISGGLSFALAIMLFVGRKALMEHPIQNYFIAHLAKQILS